MRSQSYSHSFSLLLAVPFPSLEYACQSCLVVCTVLSRLMNIKQVSSPHIVFNVYTLRHLHIASFHFTKMPVFVCHNVHTACFMAQQSEHSALNDQYFLLPCHLLPCFTHLWHDESNMLPITHAPTMKDCKCCKGKMSVQKSMLIIYLNAVVSICCYLIQLTAYSEQSTTSLLCLLYPYTKIDFPLSKLSYNYHFHISEQFIQALIVASSCATASRYTTCTLLSSTTSTIDGRMYFRFPKRLMPPLTRTVAPGLHNKSVYLSMLVFPSLMWHCP